MKNSSSSHIVATKHIPLRTCVACRQVKTKRELVRLVRTTGGDVEIDTTGKREGRGAYICPDSACWEKALKGKQLGITLRASLTLESRARLLKDGKELIKGVA